MEETTFFELPQELIWKMLYYLPPRDALHVCATHRKAANIICKDNNFWFEKIWRDFGDIYELKIEDIPVENRYGTYKQYWEDAQEKLVSCAEDENVECVASLLQLGVHPNFINKDGWTALPWASVWNNIDMVRWLLEYGANPNIEDKYGGTALINASKTGYTDIVRLLLERGANPNFQNKYGKTAFMAASSKGYEDIIALLLERGADPYIPPDKVFHLYSTD